MILYFSATGNSEAVANKIAAATNDTAVSMTEIGTSVALGEGEMLGIVTPTYFWGLPTYVADKLNDLVIEGAAGAYIYLVATYGTTAGQIDRFAEKILAKKGVILSASYGILTVDNWTVWFDVSDREKVDALLAREAEATNAVIADILARKEVRIPRSKKKATFACHVAQMLYGGARGTKHLHVNAEVCIGCGKCAADCPVHAIEMRDGKPVWVAKQCVMCFRCLHRCPTFAIDYDGKTQRHGQYRRDI